MKSIPAELFHRFYSRGVEPPLLDFGVVIISGERKIYCLPTKYLITVIASSSYPCARVFFGRFFDSKVFIFFCKNLAVDLECGTVVDDSREVIWDSLTSVLDERLSDMAKVCFGRYADDYIERMFMLLLFAFDCQPF